MARTTHKALVVENLHAGLKQKSILQGVNLTVRPGEVLALMGPNGSGKSTLANVLMGHPLYVVTKGKAMFGGKNILTLPSFERARLGLFLSFQYPYEIPGVNFHEFLLTAYEALHGKQPRGRKEFEEHVKKALESLNLPGKFLQRDVNAGFSGGEKKKAEILQLAVLKPRIAILDETDSGLDIDALKVIAENVKRMVSPSIGFLVITHYQRLLNYLKPDRVAVMLGGKIVAEGSSALVKKLEARGYQWLEKKK